MFVVFTGLDGMGTSTIGNLVSKLDEGSILTRTPNDKVFTDRHDVDAALKGVSPFGHMLYYLSSVVAESDRLEKLYDPKSDNSTNIYMVRYLIDTVVSNRAAGINVPFEYNVFGHNILVPDLTVFVGGSEDIRQERISARGKDNLDKVLDDYFKRVAFYKEYVKLLDSEKTLYVDNTKGTAEETAVKTYCKIKQYQNNGGIFRSGNYI